MWFFFVLLLSYSSIEALNVNGTCSPTVSVVTNFDVPKYTGLWYELYRYEQAFQLAMDCVTANYTQTATGVIVDNKGVINQKLFQLVGNATLAPTLTGEAKLIVNFPSNQTTGSNYWVIDTDYDNYALVYSCTQLAPNMTSLSSWILSRKMNIDMKYLVKIVEKVESEKFKTSLSWDSFRTTDQGGKTCNASATIYPSFALVLAFLVTKLFH
ncbi:apolipoprotein D-like [Arctopsyche grandis]|uniref:apolipoprotein D-like n=1 Tax=Arctopsyche grandis TaxID=121162 RepID=UPI00406D8311